MTGYSSFNRADIKIKSLYDRQHDLQISTISELNFNKNNIDEKFEKLARHIIHAKYNHSSIILMMGGHVIRTGVQKYLIDWMEKDFISCIAMNGAGLIHDFEFALVGATTESVSRYIQEGQFGLWEETGQINDHINRGYKKGLGMGEVVDELYLKEIFIKIFFIFY